MTRDETRAAVLRVLGDIAPEADLASIKPDVSFRDQLDLDSMDFLNFVVALHDEFGVEIAEADYPRFFTLGGCVEELLARLPDATRPAQGTENLESAPTPMAGPEGTLSQPAPPEAA